MTFIRYKKDGNKVYAYEITSYWDKKKKQPRQKINYLGVVINKEKKIFEKPRIRVMKDNGIVDFGDGFFIKEFLKEYKNFSVFNKLLTKNQKDTLFTLLSYKIINPSAMRLAKIWFYGNVVRFFYKNAKITSQRISEFLKVIGDEKLQQKFFKKYIRKIASDEGIILDITALPNRIKHPFTNQGYHDKKIDKQIKLSLVVDRKKHLPLFFNFIPGNIADVSSLRTTFEEIKRLGIKGSLAIMDAGFFSRGNVMDMCEKKIDFLIRLPKITKKYKDLIMDETDDIETIKYGVKYGKRALLIKEKETKLFDDFKKDFFFYIILDPNKRGRDMNTLLFNVIGEKNKTIKKEIEYEIKNNGIMILVSSVKIKTDEVISLYYSRQIAEMMFGFSKSDSKLLPLRVHKNNTLRGYLFLMFLSLITFIEIKKKLDDDYTVEECLMILRNLKAKVYEKDLVVSDITKVQKELFNKFKILVPKTLGIQE